MFDEDQSGTISRDELTKVLLHMVRHQSKTESLLTTDLMQENSEPDLDSRPIHWLTGASADVMDVVEMQQASEMDPELYELAEGITELFDSLDVDGDGQITFDEFLEGTKRHPQLLDLFFNNEPSVGHSGGEHGERLPFAQASIQMADVEA